MPARLLRSLPALLLKTPVLAALGLLAAWLLFGWFGFEPLVKWAAPKFVAEKSRHQLSIATARFDPLALSLRVGGFKLTEPDGQPLLAFDSLFIDFEAASLLNWAWTFADIRLSGPRARLVLLPDGRLNWSALIEAFKDEEEKEARPLPRLLIRRIALDRGRVELADRKVGFATALDPLDLNLTELSTLPQDKGTYTLAATTQVGARIRWQGELSLKPLLATGRLAMDRLQLARAWPYLDARLDMAPPEGQAALSLEYRVGWADKQLSLNLDKLNLLLEQLTLRGARATAPALTLERIALSDGRFDLGRRSLDIGAIDIRSGQVRLVRDPAGRLDIQDWFAPARTRPGQDAPEARAAGAHPARAGVAAAPPWRVNLARFVLDGVGLRLTDQGFVRPLDVQAANVKIGLKAWASLGAGSPQVRVEDIGLDISGLRLLAGLTPIVVLGGISLEDGQVDLAAREARLGRLALLNGRLEAERDPQGRIALLDAFRPAQGRPLTTPSDEAMQAGPAWKYRVARAELSGFEFAARDLGVHPVATLALEGIEASAEGISQDLAAALPVRLAFRVRQGGRFEASGRLVPASAEADVRLKLSELALLPAQPYLSQTSHLVLAGGRASSAGRLKYGKQGLRYAGGFRVDDLLVNEASTGDRFLAWKSLATDELLLSQTRLDIGDLRLEGMGLKLIIYPDRSTNLRKAFQKGTPMQTPAAAPPLVPAEVEITPEETAPETPAAAPVAREEAPPTAAPALKKGAAAPAFQVGIDRLRVDRGEMDFADLSLALPFGTRIHELRGGIHGISNQPGAHAQLELDGQVDEYGLARAVGELDMFDPTAFLDIKVVFRNVEMTRLTPYTATFVGRTIASGKLSLDLDYKIKQRQLAGENQIVMDRLVLGERVESPKAKDLPLDLAITVLQDANGVIELGLPVSGSLDDPRFSYGRIIWKAIANVIVKLATAPFRALGRLLGISGEKLEKVAFDLGDAELLPPEREKLDRLAEALGKRPGLTLTVRGSYAPEAERPLLKERLLRRQVSEKLGIRLAEGEEPGPVSTRQPKVQAALEALYAERFGADELKTLRARHALANPQKRQEGAAGKLLSRLTGLLREKPKPLSEAELAELQGADLHELLYRRLLDGVEVSDAKLAALGQARAEAIARRLSAAGVPAERIEMEPAEKVETEGREVMVKLSLGTARKAAAEAAPTAPAAAP